MHEGHASSHQEQSASNANLTRIQVLVDRPWLAPLRERLTELGLGYEPVCGEVDLEGASLLSALRSLGAVSLDDLPVSWSFRAAVSDDIIDERASLDVRGSRIVAFGGAFVFELDGHHYGAASVGAGSTAALVLAARSLEGLTTLLARIRAADADSRLPVLQVFGAERHGRSRRPVPAVLKEQLVLPPALRRDVLSYADTLTRQLSSLERQLTRGIMLLGRPGTGKTHTARHLMTRLAEARKYLFVRSTATCSPFDDRTFERMVQSIEAETSPAVVLVEDVDRMFDTGTTTAEYFLNVLDGLLQPRVPVLWIATSNDPGKIAPNLLDRPGRFDRVFLFPMPDAAGRADLFRLYATEPLEDGEPQALAEVAHDLTGAHIREICQGAAFRRDADEVTYGQALRVELERMVAQHRDSRAYERALRGTGTPGFSVAAGGG